MRRPRPNRKGWQRRRGRRGLRGPGFVLLIGGTDGMKVLVDRNIARNAITHRSVLTQKVIRWGDRDHAVSVAGRQRFAPRSDEQFRLEQLPYLAGVSVLAKTGRIQLFSSFELVMERMRNREPDEGYVGFNLFSGVPIASVRGPVSRTIVISGTDPGVGITEAEQMDFFRSIKDSRFLEIRALIGDAHLDDAYHFWTAESESLNAFLTMDKRFWRVVQQNHAKLQSSVAVLTPNELCGLMGQEPIDIETLSTETPAFS